jgi:hypothetical protein
MPKLSTRKRQFEVQFRDVRPLNDQFDELELSDKQTEYRRKVSFDEYHSSSGSSLDMDITSSFLNSEYALTPQPKQEGSHDLVTHDPYNTEPQIDTSRPLICRQSRSSCLMSLDTERQVASVSDDDLSMSASHDARSGMHHLLRHDTSLCSTSPDKSFHWGHFVDVADSSPYKPTKRVCNKHLDSSSLRFVPYHLPESKQTSSDDLNLAINSISLLD